jgi:hypothetical protein
MALDARLRASPHFDSARPWQVKRAWRYGSERSAAGFMVRAAAQQLAMGVRPVFWFKWQAGPFSWVCDWREGGNVAPKIHIPVHAVFSSLYLRYGSTTGGAPAPLEIASPDPRYRMFAHRFAGPEGRLTVLYAAPLKAVYVMGDELEGNAVPEGIATGAAGTADASDVRRPPAPGNSVFEIRIHDLAAGAVRMDVLARDIRPVSAGEPIPVAEMPIYIVEPVRGKAWPDDFPR